MGSCNRGTRVDSQPYLVEERCRCHPEVRSFHSPQQESTFDIDAAAGTPGHPIKWHLGCRKRKEGRGAPPPAERPSPVNHPSLTRGSGMQDNVHPAYLFRGKASRVEA